MTELERYTFVLLRRPPDAPDYPEGRLEEIQEQHLAHLQAMRERGVLLLAGPFDDQPDESLRGLGVYTTGLEETRELTARDPAVIAGRLAADVMTWWTLPGSLRASGSS
ncbi:MAG TPA: YciI family protein [Gaiellaceae bacterium]